MKEFAIGTIRSLDALAGLEQEWRALEPRVLQLPFVTFDWVVAWWTHLRSQRVAIKDELYIITFREQDGRLAGVAPMMVTCRPNAGPLSMRQLQFIGADTNITELRCIAAPVEDMETIYAALVAYLQTKPVACDWLKLTGIVQGTSVPEKVKAAFGDIGWSREVPNFYLELKPTWAEFKSGLSRNIKESLRKCYNAPKRDGLEFEFSVVNDGADMEVAISEFLRLHGQRAQLAETVVHPDVFRAESSRLFLFDVCRRFAGRDKLRAFQLKYQGAVIATRIGFVMGDSLYLYYSGYDPAFAKYSAMTTTVAEAIQYAIANGFRTVNLSTGRDVSKERWSPMELTYHELEVASASPLGAFKYRVFNVASNSLKTNPLGSWLGKLIARNAD